MKNTKMLKKNYEYRAVLTKGTYYSGKYLEMFVLKNKTNRNLLGIAINKKIAGSVQRNRIKRLIRESYRLQEEKIEIGNSIIFLWKKKMPIEYAKYSNVFEDMKNIFLKAEVMKK